MNESVLTHVRNMQHFFFLGEEIKIYVLMAKQKFERKS